MMYREPLKTVPFAAMFGEGKKPPKRLKWTIAALAAIEAAVIGIVIWKVVF